MILDLYIVRNGGSFRLRISWVGLYDVIVKELSVAAKDVIQTYHFQGPYSKRPHGSTENGLNLDDGYIPYNQLYTVLTETLAGYAHFYSYGASKCKFISELIGAQFKI